MKNIRESFLFNSPIAHRGLHDETVPENSRAAFERAIQLGYPIEMDVRFTKDKKVIVFHDEKAKRMTGLPKDVIQYTYDEIKDIPLKGTDQRIMLFSDFLQFVNGQVPILIEIKDEPGKKGLVEETIRLLQDYHGEYALQSFNPVYVSKMKKLAPDVLCGQLVSKIRFAKGDRFMIFLHKVVCFLFYHLLFPIVMHFLNPDFINYDKRMIRKHEKQRRKHVLLCWTLKSQAEFEKFAAFADNILFENILPENFPTPLSNEKP